MSKNKRATNNKNTKKRKTSLSLSYVGTEGTESRFNLGRTPIGRDALIRASHRTMVFSPACAGRS